MILVFDSYVICSNFLVFYFQNNVLEKKKSSKNISKKKIYCYCLLNDKKYAQKVWSKDLVYKNLSVIEIR